MVYSTPQPIAILPSGTTRYSGFPFPINTLDDDPEPEIALDPPSNAYLETDRIRALAIYAETGNQNETARQSGIPQSTVRNWVNDEGTSGLIGELRSTIRYNHGWTLANMVGRSLKLMDQAMAEGDPVVLKDGRTIFKRASLKDLTIVSSILIDKWMMISGAISNETVLLGKMAELGQQLTGLGASLSRSTIPSPEPGTPIMGAPGENLVG